MLAWYRILYMHFNFYIFFYTFLCISPLGLPRAFAAQQFKYQRGDRRLYKQLQVFCIHFFCFFPLQGHKTFSECPGVKCRKQCKLEPQKHGRQLNTAQQTKRKRNSKRLPQKKDSQNYCTMIYVANYWWSIVTSSTL